jgi:hypothetical protein
MVSCTDEVDKFEVVSLPSPHRISLVDTLALIIRIWGNQRSLAELLSISRMRGYATSSAVSLDKYTDRNFRHATIAGIIFLHDIAHDNYPSLNNAILTVQRLSGPHSLRNVILTTTNWSNIEPGERQKLLANAAWEDLISLGARPG